MSDRYANAIATTIVLMLSFFIIQHIAGCRTGDPTTDAARLELKKTVCREGCMAGFSYGLLACDDRPTPEEAQQCAGDVGRAVHICMAACDATQLHDRPELGDD